MKKYPKELTNKTYSIDELLELHTTYGTVYSIIYKSLNSNNNDKYIG
jgi:hypothetical protein